MMRCLAPLFLAVAALSGCSSYRAPDIEVRDARAIERSDVAELWHVDLALRNENQDPLELLEFEYRVLVDGAEVYSARRAAEATLSARSTKTLVLPAVLRFDRCPAAADADLDGHRWRIDGTLLYATPGEIAEILFDTGVRKPTTGFTGSGTFGIAGAAGRSDSDPDDL